jgi:hypothetical protein
VSEATRPTYEIEGHTVEAPILILAEHYRAASDIARKYWIAPRDWRFVRNSSHVRGYHGATVLESGWAHEAMPLAELGRRFEAREYLRTYEALFIRVGRP